MIINKETWPAWASEVATDGDPLLHSPAAMERYMKVMSPYITNVKAPHGKFKAKNSCQLIHFQNDSEREMYDRAVKDMMEKYERLQKELPSDAKFQEFLIQGEFRRRAELIRAPLFAKLMLEAVENGYAAIAACNNRPTIARIVRTLSAMGISRDKISLIWGGNDLFAKEKRLTEMQIAQFIYRLAKGETLSNKQLRQLHAQVSESSEQKEEALADYGEDLRLGGQTREDRQREIDRFQNGKSLFCCFTFAAGGVGLSLHHTDKNRKGQPVSLRPRRVFLTPTYSAQDFVQGLGRGHRSVFSLSDTEQTIMFYAKTIEEQVMARVSLKLKCLTKVVQAKESWADAVWESARTSKEEMDEKLRREKERYEKELDGADVNIDDLDTEDDDDQD